MSSAPTNLMQEARGSSYSCSAHASTWSTQLIDQTIVSVVSGFVRICDQIVVINDRVSSGEISIKYEPVYRITDLIGYWWKGKTWTLILLTLDTNLHSFVFELTCGYSCYMSDGSIVFERSIEKRQNHPLAACRPLLWWDMSHSAIRTVRGSKRAYISRKVHGIYRLDPFAGLSSLIGLANG